MTGLPRAAPARRDPRGLLRWVALAALLAGCAGRTSLAPRSRPAGAFGAVRTVAIAEPDVNVSRLGVASSTLEAEWSAAARVRVRGAIEKALEARGVATAPVAPSWRRGPLADRALLLDAVMEGLRECGPYEDEACRDSFDHGVGSLDDALPAGADALLVVLGQDEISTRTRVATEATLVPVNVALWMLVASGGGSAAPPLSLRDATTYLGAALLGRDGEVLWWSGMVGRSCCDLREPGGAEESVELLLERFPLPQPASAPGGGGAAGGTRAAPLSPAERKTGPG